MAEPGATATGLTELRAVVNALPQTVTAALRHVAATTAYRIRERAQGLLRAQLKTSARALVDGIIVLDESAERRYVVDSTRPASQPTNLPLWVERGTRYMAARPYMRPAGDAEDARYRRDALAAAEAVVAQLEKR